MGILKSVETEILVHENLKHSQNLLKMVGTLETKTELFLIFENFKSLVPASKIHHSEDD